MALQPLRECPSMSLCSSSHPACGATSFRYILDQNAAIANGTTNGTTINLKFLGIGNGITVSQMDKKYSQAGSSNRSLTYSFWN